jgi:hypothetical protein
VTTSQVADCKRECRRRTGDYSREGRSLRRALVRQPLQRVAGSLASGRQDSARALFCSQMPHRQSANTYFLGFLQFASVCCPSATHPKCCLSIIQMAEGSDHQANSRCFEDYRKGVRPLGRRANPVWRRRAGQRRLVLCCSDRRRAQHAARASNDRRRRRSRRPKWRHAERS